MGVFDLFERAFYYTVDAPVTFVRNFIENRRAKRPITPYYHRIYPRVTPVEDCRMDDAVCLWEAQEQYKRDKRVEENILKLLRERISKCSVEEGPNAKMNCRGVLEDYEREADNFETKYGGLGAYGNPLRCMMRQKYRVYYERKKAMEQQGAIAE